MLPAKDRLKKLFLFIEPTKQENFILKKDGLHSDEDDDKKSDNMEKEIEEKINESEKEPEPTDTIRSSDICGFGKTVKGKFLTWNDCKNYKWFDKYKDTVFRVEINLNMRRTGLMIRSIVQ